MQILLKLIKNKYTRSSSRDIEILINKLILNTSSFCRGPLLLLLVFLFTGVAERFRLPNNIVL